MNLTKLALTESYSDPEFETYYNDLEKNVSVFDIQAKQDGLTNSPNTLKHYKVQVVTPLKSTIQKALDFNYSKFPPVSDMAVMQNLRTNSDNKVFELTKEKNDKERKLNQLRGEQKHLKASCKIGLSSKLRVIIPASFGLIEGFLVFDMARNTSLPFIVCVFWGLLTALVSGFGLHLAGNYICKSKTPFQAKRRWITVIAISFVVALSLGLWRANSYSEASNINSQIDPTQTATPSTEFSPWPFVIISFVSFLVALAFEIKYWLTDEEKKNLRKYEEKSEEVKNEEHQYNLLKQQIDDIKTKSAFDSGRVMRKQEYACSNEQRLLSLAQDVINRYEGINVDCRKDYQCPAFFGEQINFGFKLYFTPLFNSLKRS